MKIAAAAVLCLFWISLPVPVLGNAGPPSRGGQLVSEPSGLKDVTIRNEHLFIDLRPLDRGELATVQAVYELDNLGPEKAIDLVFASGAEVVADFRVRLEDKLIESAPAANATLPASWRPPESTPGLRGEKEIGFLRYSGRKVKPIAFSLVLPSGRQRLEVHYRAEAAVHYSGRPAVYRQFAYVLAPAREWGGFEGLNVVIALPSGWLAASMPALKRDDDILLGSFPELPADAIALTLQAPVDWKYEALFYSGLAILLLFLGGGAFLCWRFGRSRGRSGLRLGPIAALLAVFYGLAVLGAGIFFVLGRNLAIPALQRNPTGYGNIFALVGIVLLGLLAMMGGFAICAVAAMVARRRSG
jgi:hypothetical protein